MFSSRVKQLYLGPLAVTLVDADHEREAEAFPELTGEEVADILDGRVFEEIVPVW